jgi:predicted amidohydrolase
LFFWGAAVSGGASVFFFSGQENTMKVALAVPCLTTDRAANIAAVAELTREAARQGARLVVFPEAVLTGFVNTGDPAHDRLLAVPIPGPETEHLASVARECSLHLALGLLERDADAIYDSAILFGPDGRILLKYRRISPTWHGRQADPTVYREGTTIPVCHTPLGSFAFLICGDITFDNITDRVRALKPDWLLFPLARQFDEDVHDEREWKEQEIPFYGERVARMGANTLLVNYVGEMDPCFGGAVAYLSDGQVKARHPLHQPGLLLVEFPGEQ